MSGERGGYVVEIHIGPCSEDEAAELAQEVADFSQGRLGAAVSLDVRCTCPDACAYPHLGPSGLEGEQT